MLLLTFADNLTIAVWNHLLQLGDETPCCKRTIVTIPDDATQVCLLHVARPRFPICEMPAFICLFVLFTSEITSRGATPLPQPEVLERICVHGSMWMSACVSNTTVSAVVASRRRAGEKSRPTDSTELNATEGDGWVNGEGCRVSCGNCVFSKSIHPPKLFFYFFEKLYLGRGKLWNSPFSQQNLLFASRAPPIMLVCHVTWQQRWEVTEYTLCQCTWVNFLPRYLYLS